MSTPKGPTEGGSGGKRGHSNTERWGTHQEVKAASRVRRRLESKEVIRESVRWAAQETQMAREMPKFTPAPPDLIERFQAAVSKIDNAELRKMFGYPAAFAAGNMFAGVFGESLFVRLAESDRANFFASKTRNRSSRCPGEEWRSTW